MRPNRRLVVCALIALTTASCGGQTPPASEQGSEASPSTASLLSELSAFVERTRGLQFRQKVKVRALADPAIAEEVQKLGAGPVDVARLEPVLTILGLLAPEADLAALLTAGEHFRAGFYEPETEELVIRDDRTPFVRSVLVHELTHALDDQHFGINREIGGDEAAAAYRALVEGSAARVEALYVSSLPTAEQQQIEAERERIRTAAGVPPAVRQLLDFPSTSGSAFVEALSKEGPERLDGAFASPPTASAQILDPSRYLSGDAPQEVRPPRTEGTVVDQGEIGAVLLRLVLEAKLEPAVAEEAARGWDGDRYATWRSPDGRTCIRAQFAAATPADARRLEAALIEWVARTTDREVDSAGLLLKACGPAPGQP